MKIFKVFKVFLFLIFFYENALIVSEKKFMFRRTDWLDKGEGKDIKCSIDLDQ